MDFFSGGKPNLICSAVHEEINSIPVINNYQSGGFILDLYNGYIRDYKLPIFLLIILVLFLWYRYRETKKKKKIEQFMKDKYNVPPYNQFIPYQHQVETVPIKMNPYIDPQKGTMCNTDLDLSRSKYNRTYYHGTDMNQKRESNLCHPYGWERSFNSVDDHFINGMAGQNEANINNYNNLLNMRDHNLRAYAHM